MNIFSWSLPFVTEKVTEMLFHLIKVGASEEDEEEISEDVERIL